LVAYLRKKLKIYDMFRSYVLTAFRNLSKNKLNASINIVGLAVAFTCSILLFLMVHYEFSYDDFQKNGDRLFQLYHLAHEEKGDTRAASMSYPTVASYKAEVAGIVKATAIMSGGRDVSYKDHEVGLRITTVDSDFLDMFTFPTVAGNAAHPLDGLNAAVITESGAKAVFGKEDPIGKTVKAKLDGVWNDLVVTAVVKDPPTNSTIQFGLLARIELMPDYAANKNNWDNQSHLVFVQLAPGVTPAQVEANIRKRNRPVSADNELQMKTQGYRKDANGEFVATRLAAFPSLHFDAALGGRNGTNKTYLYTLLLIAMVVMAIACFNFINLNVARSFTRAREVGIRKTIGAGRRQIFLQLWLESFLLFGVALIIALVAASLLLQPFNTLFTEKLTMQTLLRPGIIGLALSGMTLISFLAGGYPADLVARFKTVEVLKGKVSMRRSSLLRSGLITAQFVISSALICGTLVIYRQFQYLRTAPLGMDQESVISIPVKRPEDTHKYVERLRLQFASQPQVAGVTASNVNIGLGEDKSISQSVIGFTYNGKGMSSTILTVDYDFFEVMGIKPLAGRVFSHAFPADTSGNNAVVTEAMAKQFTEKQVAGLAMRGDTSSPGWNIVGVVPDFHLYSMNEELRPITILMSNKEPLPYILVKVRTSNPRAAMQLVQAAFHQLEPDNTIAASWVTENTARWYDKEQRLSSIFFSAAAVAIVLSCLGLFAIVSLIMAQRKKEVGVRKVLGASIPSLTGLLSGDFIRLVVIAFFIATPISAYFLHQWLQNFIYRTELSWWIFPLAGVVTLLIALVTVGIQTVRAAVVNPVRSLRSE
jgi:putative ABC transport system permease protein